MRRLDKAQERNLALRLAGDPRTARAHFAIEIAGASVLRTYDSRCHVVLPPSQPGELHVLGIGPLDELLEVFTPLPMDMRVTMSTHMFAQMAHMARTRSEDVLELYVGTEDMTPRGMPPPRPDFDVRPVLHSDIPALDAMPMDAGFLFEGYGGVRGLLARSVAFGAFNGTNVVSLATAEMGRSFANILAYTLHDHRGSGFATQCVAAMLDRLRPAGERPLFCIRAENGSPERAMARRFGLQMAGKQISVARGDLAL